MRFLAAGLLLATIAPQPLALAGPEEDRKAFVAFYQSRFPDIPFQEFANGIYAIDADARAQWQDIEEFPYFKRWFDELGARPAVKRDMEAGSELSIDTSKLTPEDIDRLRAMLYNQRARPAPEGGLL